MAAAHTTGFTSLIESRFPPTMRLLDPGARVMQETHSPSFTPSASRSLPLGVRWQVCWHSRNNVRKNGTTRGRGTAGSGGGRDEYRGEAGGYPEEEDEKGERNKKRPDRARYIIFVTPRRSGEGDVRLVGMGSGRWSTTTRSFPRGGPVREREREKERQGKDGQRKIEKRKKSGARRVRACVREYVRARMGKWMDGWMDG